MISNISWMRSEISQWKMHQRRNRSKKRKTTQGERSKRVKGRKELRLNTRWKIES